MQRDDEQDASLGYAAWKGWTADRFATRAKGDDEYFSRELAEITRVSPVRDVLEVGYGNGAFLGYCRSKSWSVTGTEILPELLEAARGEGFDVHDAREIDAVPDASFDLVALFDVFEHIPPEASVDFLRTLSAKLRPGGRMVLRFPNADSWLGNPLQNGDVTHVNAIGRLKMEYYAREAELELIRFRAVKRRGFETSLVHGFHAATAGVLATAAAGLARAVYFPDLKVVLNSSNVVCILGRRR